ncbi:hypothetical protein KKE78_00715 [Patescibacteria group bacterium]|nr:hypothetical protein [Patescibacteria group bacterium]
MIETEAGKVGFSPELPYCPDPDLEKRTIISDFLKEFTGWAEEEVSDPERIFFSEACKLLNLVESRTLDTLRGGGIISPSLQSTGRKMEYQYTLPQLALLKLVLISGDNCCALKEIVGKIKPLIEETDYAEVLGLPLSEMKPAVPKLPEDDWWFLKYGDVLVQVLGLTPASFPKRRERSLLRGESSINPSPEKAVEGNNARLSEERIRQLLVELSPLPKMDLFSVRKAPSFISSLINGIIQEALAKEGNFLVERGKTDLNAVWDDLTFGTIERCLSDLLNERKRESG